MLVISIAAVCRTNYSHRRTLSVMPLTVIDAACKECMDKAVQRFMKTINKRNEHTYDKFG